MKSRTPITTLTALAAGLVLLAAPLAAAPAPRSTPAPIAIEQLGGTTLSITPRIGYESAVLRVSGPDGYAMTTRFPSGTPVTVDLRAASPKREESQPLNANNVSTLASPTRLPDGRYRYEIVFSDRAGERRVHTGLFYVEGGSAVAREAKQAELGEIRTALRGATSRVHAASEGSGSPGALALEVYDSLVISDHNGNGVTFLTMDSDNYTVWEFYNSDGVFSIEDFGGDSIDDLTIIDGVGVGLGTSAPQAQLHVVDNSIYPLRLTAGGGWDFTLGLGNCCLVFYDEALEDVLILEHSAPDDALVADEIGIGIGVRNPNAPLHVIGDRFNSANTMQIQRNDGITPNIRFRTTGGAVTQNWLFQNNANSGVFAIRDETGGNSVLRLRPGAPENGLTINPNGSFTTSTGATLTGGGVWQNASSRALKQEITALPLDAALAALTDLRAVTFAYKKTPGESHVGFIAEEVPDLVATATRKTLSTMEIVGVLTRVVQEQQKVNAELRRRLAEVEAQLDE